MSQKPNQHCQEEHDVDHESADSIDEASARMQDYTSICYGVVRWGDLV